MPSTDIAKFQNTVLYLLRRCLPIHPGLTTLLKMLYFADYEHYRRFLSSITGAEYVALERGPVVDGYKDLFQSMEDDGILRKHEATILGHKDKKFEYRPDREPDSSIFSSTELEVLDAVAARYGGDTGAMLSEKTHLEGPWSLAWDWRNPGRRIPYVLFRWVDNLPDETDLAEAKKQLARPKVAARVAKLQAATS